jgi:hypothetical protein
VAQDGQMGLLGRAPDQMRGDGDLVTVEDAPQEDGQGQDPLLRVAAHDEEAQPDAHVRGLAGVRARLLEDNLPQRVPRDLSRRAADDAGLLGDLVEGGSEARPGLPLVPTRGLARPPQQDHPDAPACLLLCECQPEEGRQWSLTKSPAATEESLDLAFTDIRA